MEQHIKDLYLIVDIDLHSYLIFPSLCADSALNASLMGQFASLMGSLPKENTHSSIPPTLSFQDLFPRYNLRY